MNEGGMDATPRPNEGQAPDERANEIRRRKDAAMESALKQLQEKKPEIHGKFTEFMGLVQVQENDLTPEQRERRTALSDELGQAAKNDADFNEFFNLWMKYQSDQTTTPEGDEPHQEPTDQEIKDFDAQVKEVTDIAAEAEAITDDAAALNPGDKEGAEKVEQHAADLRRKIGDMVDKHSHVWEKIQKSKNRVTRFSYGLLMSSLVAFGGFLLITRLMCRAAGGNRK